MGARGGLDRGICLGVLRLELEEVEVMARDNCTVYCTVFDYEHCYKRRCRLPPGATAQPELHFTSFTHFTSPVRGHRRGHFARPSSINNSVSALTPRVSLFIAPGSCSGPSISPSGTSNQPRPPHATRSSSSSRRLALARSQAVTRELFVKNSRYADFKKLEWRRGPEGAEARVRGGTMAGELRHPRSISIGR